MLRRGQENDLFLLEVLLNSCSFQRMPYAVKSNVFFKENLWMKGLVPLK